MLGLEELQHRKQACVGLAQDLKMNLYLGSNDVQREREVSSEL